MTHNASGDGQTAVTETRSPVRGPSATAAPPAPRPDPDTATLSAFDRLRGRDHAAIGRALTVLEAGGPSADRLRRRLHEVAGSARVVGFAGPPGVGKSTLINAYIAALRASDRTVAVLAVDPSSPLTGGALLGDRTRMGQHTSDPGVFVRSVAARGHLGGLSIAVPSMLDALAAAGFDDIVLEAVGAGQSEVEIHRFADTTVVLNAPGLGDDVQAIKAGILEVADILVVHKADLPQAAETARQLESMLSLRATATMPPVLLVSSVDSTGVSELVDAIDWSHRQRGEVEGGPRRRAIEMLRQTTIDELIRRLETSGDLASTGDAFYRGDLTLAAAVDKLMKLVADAAAPTPAGPAR